MAQSTRSATDILARKAVPLSGGAADYDLLLDLIGNARIVLLGEATHGTHEFYRERARITRRLIEEKGFTTIAVEADWPDAYRVNRFIRGVGTDGSAAESLAGFHRFPLWMWRNTEVVDLVAWLWNHNRQVHRPVGFYGLDLYSLFESIEATLGFLEQADPAAAERARERYACFDRFASNSQAYGYAASLGIHESCQSAVIEQLLELRRSAAELASRDGAIPEDEYFFAEQNARLVKNAEEYYRAMFGSRSSSWNLRDCHMADTIQAVQRYFDGKGLITKIVVWEHNSHVGDARATQMGAGGEWNVGQLMRERYGDEVRSVGFSTYRGSVTAARNWDEPAEQRWVRPALPGSYEALFHEVRQPRFLLDLSDPALVAVLEEPRLQRAIGVVYRPETERGSHYFLSRLPEQFDAMIHIDETTALEPLEKSRVWSAGETPDTYPFEL